MIFYWKYMIIAKISTLSFHIFQFYQFWLVRVLIYRHSHSIYFNSINSDWSECWYIHIIYIYIYIYCIHIYIYILNNTSLCYFGLVRVGTDEPNPKPDAHGIDIVPRVLVSSWHFLGNYSSTVVIILLLELSDIISIPENSKLSHRVADALADLDLRRLVYPENPCWWPLKPLKL